MSAFIPQPIYGFPDLSLLSKLYKERYIVMFVLNAVACVDILADLLVVVCLKWQKARDQEKKQGTWQKRSKSVTKSSSHKERSKPLDWNIEDREVTTILLIFRALHFGGICSLLICH
ncbi:hypothetical protein M422DRAFT_243679 [Sphaerobolus stellatus SS14]|nr:hypothetical protein M422DRAFT_243679 [Sphaerobolus stellatus SS14]